MTISSPAKLLSRPMIAVILLVVLSLSCSLGIPVPKNEVFGLIDGFIELVENGKNDQAYALPDKNAQSKINYQSFLAAKDDFKLITNLFRNAGIDTKSEDQLPIEVKNLAGKPGGVTFVAVNEGGVWKIANLIDRGDVEP